MEILRHIALDSVHYSIARIEFECRSWMYENHEYTLPHWARYELNLYKVSIKIL